MSESPRYAVPTIPRFLVATVLLTLAVVVLGLSRPAPAHGATFVVATTTDAYDATPGNGVCQGVLGFPCSLRAAIQEANALAGPDVITLPAGTYNLTRSGAGEDSASTGDLDITSDLTINGAGAATTIIDVGDLDRVFHVVSGTVSISGVTIRNGQGGGGGIHNSSAGTLTLANSTVSSNAGGGISNLGTLTLTNSTVSSNTGTRGGGIYNSGTLTLTSSTVSGNLATDGGGGGIYNSGTLTLTNSTVSGNDTYDSDILEDGGSGGGIYNSGTLTLTSSTVSGNDAVSNYDASYGGGIFSAPGGFVTLTNSTVSVNEATYGGGFFNDGTLTLTDSTVSGNIADAVGGGFYNDGTLTLTDSTVSGNFTYFFGGGFYNDGTLTLTNSTVSGNDTYFGGSGGGIYNSGTLTLTNSTVSGNIADVSGGGIYNGGTLTVTNSTITNNTADRDANGAGDGGGIASTAGAVNLKNTIVAGNFDLSSPVEPDCFGTLTSQGYNLIQTVSPGCSITGDATGNVTGQGANLAPLANNGGPTQTHAILAGSPAIDAGSPDCPPPATDQRGVARPLGSGCDIGAYESSFTSSPPPGDSDGDGWTDEAEAWIETNPAVGCGYTSGGAPASENWPPDLVESNTINISDVLALKPVFGMPVPPTSKRYDIVPSGGINISDVLALKPVFAVSCTP